MACRRLVFLTVLALALITARTSYASDPEIGSDAFWLELEQKYGGKHPAVIVLDEFIVKDAKVHRIYAVLDAVAGASYGQQTIRLHKGEKIEKLTVRVQGAGKEPRDLDPKYIIQKELTKDVRQIVITIPKLAKRTLIDLSYEYKTYFFSTHRFGAEIPILKARFQIEFPTPDTGDREQWLKDSFITRPGSLRPSMETGKGQKWTWELTDLPAFTSGRFCPPPNDRMPFVAYNASRLSALIDQSRCKTFEKSARVRDQVLDGGMRNKALALTASSADTLDKARAILGFVQSDIQCDADEVGFYDPREVEETFAEKKGDCTDVNALLVSMLRCVGITANPVLVRWRGNGTLDPRIYDPYGFDWQIARIEIRGKTYFLDGGHNLCPFGLLPSEAEGTWAVVLRGNNVEVIKLPVSDPENNRISATTYVSLDSSGRLDGMCVEHSTGIVAFDARRAFAKLGRPDVKTLMEEMLAGMISGAVLHDHSLKGLQELDKPLEIRATFSSNSFFIPGDQIVLCPSDFVDPGTKLVLEKYEGSAEYRPEFPYCWSARDTVIIELPEGYGEGALPAGINIDKGYAAYSVNYRRPSAQQILFVRRLDIKAMKPNLPFEEVKQFLDEVAKKDNERLVIDRK